MRRTCTRLSLVVVIGLMVRYSRLPCHRELVFQPALCAGEPARGNGEALMGSAMSVAPGAGRFPSGGVLRPVFVNDTLLQRQIGSP